METKNINNILNETFTEIALVLSGIFAIHDIPDDLASHVMKHLDFTHENILSKLREVPHNRSRPSAQRSSQELHPAVAAFLIKLKRTKQPHRRAS